MASIHQRPDMSLLLSSSPLWNSWCWQPTLETTSILPPLPGWAALAPSRPLGSIMTPAPGPPHHLLASPDCLAPARLSHGPSRTPQAQQPLIPHAPKPDCCLLCFFSYFQLTWNSFLPIYIPAHEELFLFLFDSLAVFQDDEIKGNEWWGEKLGPRGHGRPSIKEKAVSLLRAQALIPGFKSWLPHLLAIWPRGSHLTSLCLN